MGVSRRQTVLLASFYGCYFAALGSWLPYWPVYLHSIGFNLQQIGWLTAIALGVKVVAPLFWGQLADRVGRYRVTIVATLLTSASFTLFFFSRDFDEMAWVTAVYNFCNSGPMALVETTTLEVVSGQDGAYGKIRRWGSVGFIVTSFGVGWLLDRTQPALLLPIIWGWLVVGAMLSLLVPQQSTTASATTTTGPAVTTPVSWSPWYHPSAPWFYLAAMAMQFSHGAYYGFMSLHLQQHGFSATAIGLLWTLGVVAEIVLMSYSSRLLGRWGIVPVLSLSLLMAVLRWSMYAMPPTWSLLLAGQLLHAFTFAAFHIASVRWIYHHSSPAARATAQAWYASLAYGVGGSLGLAAAGSLFADRGAATLFLVMACVASLGWLASRRVTDTPPVTNSSCKPRN
ncbi:MAG: MFS transporter [Magnetococcales bacterium]|nr:MFS transporter [Magnetococcales bacterium]